jgi:UDP-glucose 4-epimerase
MGRRQAAGVLVTGGSGFVGSAVVGALLARGYRVVATARRDPPPGSIPPGLAWLHWDAGRQPLPDADWAQLHGMVHLAAPTDKASPPESARAHFDVSVAATFRLLEAARQYGVGRFVLGSTGDALGPTAGPAREGAAAYRPTSFYGAAKACAELLCRAYGSEPAAVVLRFFHPYGPGGERFLVNRLLRAVREGREVTVEGSEGIRLNPVWVGDVAEGVCRALEADRPGVYHLAGRQTVTLRRLLKLMGRLTGREPQVRTLPGPPPSGHAGRWGKARRVLGFRPRVLLEEGLGRLLAGECERERAGALRGE